VTMKAQQINRRDFLTKSSIGLAGVGAGLIDSGNKNEDYHVSNNTGQPVIKEYRVLGRTGFKVSDIGCGPVSISNENVLKTVLDTGVNFIDTAEFYSNGNNELLVGKAIKGFNRSSIFLNTKIGITVNDAEESIITRVKKCLERLDTNYLDGLTLWNAGSVKEIKNKYFHDAFQRLKNEGRVKYCGVSCHGSNMGAEPEENMENIIGNAVEDGRFDMVLFVYNYVQQEMGQNILKECAKKNIGTTLMKTDPFGGTYLNVLEFVKNYLEKNQPIPENARKVYDTIIEKQKKAEAFLQKDQLLDLKARREAAISFVLSEPSVHSVLISFKTFNDITDYVSLSGTRMTTKNASIINSLKESCDYLYCRHACGLCESHCPYGVPVNTIMRYNHYFMAQGREKYAIQKFYELSGSKSDRCLDCQGFCQMACPYGVPIHALLTVAHNNLSLRVA
jgi:predicted aldo/keto reductase-like oxidoreductase